MVLIHQSPILFINKVYSVYFWLQVPVTVLVRTHHRHHRLANSTCEYRVHKHRVQ
jgi:hypothetical protein